MRNYVKAGKILRILQLIFMLLIIIYLIFVSSVSILNINNIKDIEKIKELLINVYQIGIVGIIVLNIVYYKTKKYSFDKLISNIIMSLAVLPLIALIMFYFDLIGHLMLSFWIFVVFLVVDLFINEFNKKVKHLHKVCIGKEK